MRGYSSGSPSASTNDWCNKMALNLCKQIEIRCQRNDSSLGTPEIPDIFRPNSEMKAAVSEPTGPRDSSEIG